MSIVVRCKRKSARTLFSKQARSGLQEACSPWSGTPSQETCTTYEPWAPLVSDAPLNGASSIDGRKTPCGCQTRVDRERGLSHCHGYKWRRQMTELPIFAWAARSFPSQNVSPRYDRRSIKTGTKHCQWALANVLASWRQPCASPNCDCSRRRLRFALTKCKAVLRVCLTVCVAGSMCGHIE